MYIDNRNSDKPSVIVPDIHGRVDFIKKVLELYPTDKYDIIFLGDILHREGNREFWQKASALYWKTQQSFDSNFEEFDAWMLPEINVAVACVKLLLENKVYVLRGNHDDLLCNLVGDFGKYVRNPFESQLFRWALKRINIEFYKFYEEYENKIPYLYIGKNFIASHTVAVDFFSLKDIKAKDKNTHYNFCWTDNVFYDNFTKNFESNLFHLAGKRKVPYWFIGHRPITDDNLYRSQMNGQLIQINHPNKWVVVEVIDGKMTAKRID